ncbi:hypothetical protein pneo_cds_834 [Pandoravirus neocaledonia]|uniref:Uncharacterized protein n=1 Tax=Pandoravirus neocaledonia TaxID=2107708 RepID=A0A2U7UDA2_9VIRU|nr:hypothetical protein pneo_cds_834 [Pandoravirus neocaledonia]AVK76441.1 hypothetical protein pneo_cds_834 [Pandoravirus neocaledonia]
MPCAMNNVGATPTTNFYHWPQSSWPPVAVVTEPSGAKKVAFRRHRRGRTPRPHAGAPASVRQQNEIHKLVHVRRRIITPGRQICTVQTLYEAAQLKKSPQ